VVLFVQLYKVILTFESRYETPKYDHSNKSYCSIFSHGNIYQAVQGDSTCSFCVQGWNHVTIRIEQYIWVLLLMILTQKRKFKKMFFFKFLPQNNILFEVQIYKKAD